MWLINGFRLLRYPQTRLCFAGLLGMSVAMTFWSSMIVIPPTSIALAVIVAKLGIRPQVLLDWWEALFLLSGVIWTAIWFLIACYVGRRIIARWLLENPSKPSGLSLLMA